MDKIKKTALFLYSSIIALIPSVTYAATKEEAYKNMNNILAIAVSVGGFLVLFGIIKSGIKLATSQNNPEQRTQGLIGLGFALLGGYLIYKSLDIAGWTKGLFGI